MKKKIVSMILSLSLVISGLPLTVANAAELGDNEILQEEASSFNETDEAAETDSNANDETETADVNQTVESAGEDNAAVTADYSNINVNSEGKAVGSDGVTYDEVVYLSANTVSAFDTETQDDYIAICDAAAEWAADGVEDIVIAVDENGDLYFSCYVPGTIMAEAKQELIEEALTSESEEGANDENVSEENNVESSETVRSENSEVEDTEAEEPETITDDTMVDNESEPDAEEVTENASEEITVDDETEEVSNDDLQNSDSVTESPTVDDSIVEELETDDSDVKEPSADVLAEPKAENMELIPDMENEQIELADSVDVDVIDLGYGLNNNLNTLNATLLSDSYFSKQLNANELKVYNVARKRLTTGNTTFNLPSNVFSYNNLNGMVDSVASAISAVILTDTDKVEWFACPGGFKVKSGTYNIITNKVISCTIEVEKSDYYSKTLEESANVQINKIAIAAQNYAIGKYPTMPAYGVVEYFDDWICKNNYYDTYGGVLGTLGADVYYYCHSSYGALLKGYAVCESYAKAMSRLLDAVRIPNMYVIGLGDGEGHAWNYVQMPDENWYLLDSTWNDPTDNTMPSTREFFLTARDSYHVPKGNAYESQSQYLTFPDLSTSAYKPVNEFSFTLDSTSVDLAVKQKIKLSCSSTETNYAYPTWTSSDTSVAKVDKNGNVTAVAPGTATITLSAITTVGVELSARCEVNVYQVKNIISRTGKAADNLSLGTNGSPETLYLYVDRGESPYTAEELVDKELPISSAKNAAKFSPVKATSSKTDIADVTATLDANTIKTIITPKSAGSSAITVEFGGKKATIKVTVGELINKDMFDIDWSKAGVDETSKSIDYTGKAVAPNVTKKASADKAVKFKTTYLNNKDAGEASIIISGTGKYGGEVRYDFTINQLQIDSSHIDFKLGKKSNVYNATANPAKATVKYNGAKKTGLKLNTDYEIIYKKGSTETKPVDAGEYTLTVRGIGNYSGECTVSDKYEIEKCEINKAKVTLTLGNTLMAPKVNATVMLGKNDLPKSEYEIKYYSDSEFKNEVSASALRAKTKYYAVITAKGENMKNNASKQFTKTFTAK